MKAYASIPSPTPSSGVLKGVALLQLLLALVRLVVERGAWPSVSMMIVCSLVMLFCTKEAINDERVEHLKLKASQAGLRYGTLLTMLLYVGVLVARLNRPGSARGNLAMADVPLSAFDVLLAIMLITLGCYYYWRWQDGRDVRPGAAGS